MDDLGTDAEHMDRLYLWRAGKHGHRVHIQNAGTERTYCQVENCGGKPFDGRGAEIPSGRRLCGNCTDLAGRDTVKNLRAGIFKSEADYREPSLAVLLGEQMAETEPELFVGTASSRTRARKKQVRPAHSGKPRRNEAKYPRPFNDDLPW